MTIEVFSYISNLNANYPAFDDFKYEGDDHIRGIKLTLQTQFPNLDAVVNFTPTEANLLVGWTIRGTAASLDVGTAAGEVVQISDVGGTPGLPALDGSQLTGIATVDTLVADIDVSTLKNFLFNQLFFGQL